MTDFVDRLLGRGDTPPIRPALPSLFEPVLPLMAEPVLPMGGSPDAAPNQQPSGRPGQARAPVTAFEERVPVVGSHAPQAPADQEVTASPIGSPARSRADTPPTAGAAQGRQIVTTAFGALPAPTRPPRATEPESGPVTVPAPAWPFSGPEPDSLADAPVSELVRRVAAVRVEHPVSVGAPLHSAVLSASAAAPVVTQRAPSSEPDVQITIGRVEIKAAAPPAAPRRAAQSPKPMLSLDDYLRGRAGGDRR